MPENSRNSASRHLDPPRPFPPREARHLKGDASASQRVAASLGGQRARQGAGPRPFCWKLMPASGKFIAIFKTAARRRRRSSMPAVFSGRGLAFGLRTPVFCEGDVDDSAKCRVQVPAVAADLKKDALLLVALRISIHPRGPTLATVHGSNSIS